MQKITQKGLPGENRNEFIQKLTGAIQMHKKSPYKDISMYKM